MSDIVRKDQDWYQLVKAKCKCSDCLLFEECFESENRGKDLKRSKYLLKKLDKIGKPIKVHDRYYQALKPINNFICQNCALNELSDCEDITGCHQNMFYAEV